MYNTALSTSKSGTDIRKHLIIEVYWHCDQSTSTGTVARYNCMLLLTELCPYGKSVC